MCFSKLRNRKSLLKYQVSLVDGDSSNIFVVLRSHLVPSFINVSKAGVDSAGIF